MATQNSILRNRVRAHQGEKCCYCGSKMVAPVHGHGQRKFNPRMETLEHLRRKEDGGDNSLDNLALACRECNIGRGHMDWLTYKSYRMGELYESILERPHQRIEEDA